MPLKVKSEFEVSEVQSKSEEGEELKRECEDVFEAEIENEDFIEENGEDQLNSEGGQLLKLKRKREVLFEENIENEEFIEKKSEDQSQSDERGEFKKLKRECGDLFEVKIEEEFFEEKTDQWNFEEGGEVLKLKRKRKDLVKLKIEDEEKFIEEKSEDQSLSEERGEFIKMKRECEDLFEVKIEEDFFEEKTDQWNFEEEVLKLKRKRKDLVKLKIEDIEKSEEKFIEEKSEDQSLSEERGEFIKMKRECEDLFEVKIEEEFFEEKTDQWNFEEGEVLKLKRKRKDLVKLKIEDEEKSEEKFIEEKSEEQSLSEERGEFIKMKREFEDLFEVKTEEEEFFEEKTEDHLKYEEGEVLKKKRDNLFEVKIGNEEVFQKESEAQMKSEDGGELLKVKREHEDLFEVKTEEEEFFEEELEDDIDEIIDACEPIMEIVELMEDGCSEESLDTPSTSRGDPFCTISHQEEEHPSSSIQVQGEYSSPPISLPPKNPSVEANTIYYKKSTPQKLKRPCPFCSKMVVYLPKHVFTMHMNQKIVKEAYNSTDEKRKALVTSIKKEGIYKYNKKEMLKDKPNYQAEHRSAKEYKVVVCNKCKGFYNARTMHLHIKKCNPEDFTSLTVPMKDIMIDNKDKNVDAVDNKDKNVDAVDNKDKNEDAFDNKDKNVDAVDNKDKNVDAVDNKDKNVDAFIEDILRKFKDDDIGIRCKNDFYIQLVGRELWNKLKSKKDQCMTVKKQVMANMRKLALLYKCFLIQEDLLGQKIERMSNLYSSLEMFDRDNLKYLDMAIESFTTSNSNNVDGRYGTKKQCYHVISKAAKLIGAYFLTRNEDEKANEVKKFLDVLENPRNSIFGNARFEISKIRNENLSKPSQLSLEEDIEMFRNYVNNRINSIMLDPYVMFNGFKFCELRDLLVCKLTLFNARRGGEPCRLTLNELWEAENNKWIDHFRLEKLNELDKIQISNSKVTYQSGKRDKKLVPVLLPNDTIEPLKVLLNAESRSKAGIVTDNTYVFAAIFKSKSHVKSLPAFDNILKNISLKNREILSDKKNWRSISTIYTLMEIPEAERINFYNCTGQSKNVKGNNYQAPSAIMVWVGKTLQKFDGYPFRTVPPQESEHPSSTIVVQEECLSSPISLQKKDPSVEDNPINKKKSTPKRLKRPCPFCSKMVAYFPKHIFSRHMNEEIVREAYNTTGTSRKELINNIKKKGIYKHNEKEMLKDKPRFLVEYQSQKESKVALCSKCKGFYNARTIYRHQRKCDPESCTPLSVSMKDIMNDNKDKDLDALFTEHILSKFKDDDISIRCKNDFYIKLVGRKLWNKLKSRKDKSVWGRRKVMTNMRRLAGVYNCFLSQEDLLGRKIIRKGNIYSSLEMFDIDNFKYLEMAIESFTSSNSNNVDGRYGTKKQCYYAICRAAKLIVAYFLTQNEDGKANEVKKFLNVLKMQKDSLFVNALHEISKNPNENFPNPSQLSLFEEDIEMIRSYVNNKINSIMLDPYLIFNCYKFSELRDLLVCKLTLFNAHRGAEPCRLTLNQFWEAENKWIDECHLEKLNELDKKLVNNSKVTYQSGKGDNKLIPVLLPNDTIEPLKVLSDAESRSQGGIVKGNTYVFPEIYKSKNYVSGWRAVDDILKKIPLKNKEILSARNNRYSISTIYALMDIPKAERIYFHNFMGHSEPVNNDDNQASSATMEITEVGKALQNIIDSLNDDQFEVISSAAVEVNAPSTSASKMEAGEKSHNNSLNDDHFEVISSAAVEVNAPSTSASKVEAGEKSPKRDPFRTIPHQEEEHLSSSIQLQEEYSSPTISLSPKNPLVEDNPKYNKKSTPKRLKRPCPFCSKMVAYIPKHVFSMHMNENIVKEAYNSTAEKRKALIKNITKEGIYKHNKKEMLKDNPKFVVGYRSAKERRVVMCNKCKGFYNARTMYRHLKKCDPGGCNSLTVPMKDIMVDNKDNNVDAFTEDILSKFKDDDIGIRCKNDFYIKLFGRELWNKLKSKEDKWMAVKKQVMTHMRRVAGVYNFFLIHENLLGQKINREGNIYSSLEMFDRDNFKYLESAIDSFITSNSNNADIKYGRKNQLYYVIRRAGKVIEAHFLSQNEDEKANDVNKFLGVLQNQRNSIYGFARLERNEYLLENLRNPSQLPLEEDIEMVRSYVNNKINNIMSDPYVKLNCYKFSELRDLLVFRLTLFNALRGAEPCRLTLNQFWEAENNKWIDEFHLERLNELDKKLVNNSKVTYQSGKGDKKLVPVLLPNDTIEPLKLLSNAESRSKAGIFKDNSFVFAGIYRSKDHVSGWHAVDNILKKIPLKNKLVTHKKNWPRISTIYALMDIPEAERIYFYDFKGQSESVNENNHQAPTEVTDVRESLQKINDSLNDDQIEDVSSVAGEMNSPSTSASKVETPEISHKRYSLRSIAPQEAEDPSSTIVVHEEYSSPPISLQMKNPYVEDSPNDNKKSTPKRVKRTCPQDRPERNLRPRRSRALRPSPAI